MSDELKNTHKIDAEESDYAAEIHPTGPNMEEHVIEVMEHMNVGNEKYVRHLVMLRCCSYLIIRAVTTMPALFSTTLFYYKGHIKLLSQTFVHYEKPHQRSQASSAFESPRSGEYAEGDMFKRRQIGRRLRVILGGLTSSTGFE